MSSGEAQIFALHNKYLFSGRNILPDAQPKVHILAILVAEKRERAWTTRGLMFETDFLFMIWIKKIDILQPLCLSRICPTFNEVFLIFLATLMS